MTSMTSSSARQRSDRPSILSSNWLWISLKAHKELAKEYNHIKKMQRDKENNTKLIIKTSKDVVDELVRTSGISGIYYIRR